MANGISHYKTDKSKINIRLHSRKANEHNYWEVTFKGETHRFGSLNAIRSFFNRGIREKRFKASECVGIECTHYWEFYNYKTKEYDLSSGKKSTYVTSVSSKAFNGKGGVPTHIIVPVKTIDDYNSNPHTPWDAPTLRNYQSKMSKEQKAYHSAYSSKRKEVLDAVIAKRKAKRAESAKAKAETTKRKGRKTRKARKTTKK